jgi:hypothetical protein
VTRYAAMFDALATRGEGALGAFVMLGDPTPDACPAILDALVQGGADMIEVGIPFSDPIADGPVIEAAAMRALRREQPRPRASGSCKISAPGTRPFPSASSPTRTSSPTAAATPSTVRAPTRASTASW